MTPSRSFWTRIDRPFVFGFLVTIGGLAAIVLGLAVANLSTVLIYIALALFAALGLDPTVRFLERRGLSRAISVVVAILGLVVVAGLVVWMVLPVVIDQVASFVRSVPGMIQEFTRSDIYATLDAQFGDQFQDLVADVQTFLTDPGNIAAIGGGALQVGASIANAISGIIVVLVLTLYFVATLPSIKSGMLRLAPARDRARASDITEQITDSVGAYVMGMVVLAFCNAVLAFLLYLFLGLPFPPLMATVAFCITLIPLVGSVIFWIIGTSLALFTARGKRSVFAVGLVAAAALALSACSSSNPLDEPSDSGESSGSGDTIVVGSQAYYSNEIIAEIYAQALEAAGFDVEKQLSIGQRDAYMPDVESGDIDVFPEYTGSLLEYISDDEVDVTSPDDVYAALQEALPESLTALDFAEATDQDSYTVLKSFAEENDLKTIGDLSKVTSEVTIGAAPEFEQRPYSPAKAKEVYGVDLTFSATGPTTLESLLAGQIQVADIYTADPAFETEEIVALEDPENLIISSNVVPIVSSDIADDVSDVLNAISAKLTGEELVALNVLSTVEEQSSADIAKKWLADNDLV